MTLDEINRRRERVHVAEQDLRQARDALEQARAEYAEQEARKAGIIYGETKVMCGGKGPFFVVGYGDWFLKDPVYRLAKVKADGTASKAGTGVLWPALSDLRKLDEAGK